MRVPGDRPMSTKNEEPIAGTSLTSVAEYSETALALSDLKHRFANLVVDVTTSKGLKEAKANTFELRKLRTGLEARRKDLKAPILERGKLLDEEARRITAEIVALEEPIDTQIKAEEARLQNIELERLEAERLRVLAILERIQGIRDTPSSVQGKPSAIINGQLVKIQAIEVVEEEFGEHFQTAVDARDAVIGRLQTMLHDQRAHEAEQVRVKQEREELEQLRKDAEDRRIADEKRASEARAEADRLAQVERDRIAAEEKAERDRLAEAQRQAENAERLAAQQRESDERERLAAERAKQAEADRVRREEEQAERDEQARLLKVESDRQAEAQRQLDEQAAQLKRDQVAAAEKAETERVGRMSLVEAANDAHLLLMNLDPANKITQRLGKVLKREGSDVAPARAVIARASA
jgi:colicin import membrane protein